MKFWKPSAERDAFSVPRSVQKSIPIKRVYKDGIFEVSGKFSKTWRFFDVNYKVASPEKQEDLFKYSAEFLYKCWKRFRKYYATLTGITQNVEECLRSDTARMMFANSEFLLMFNQAPNDREVLAHILNASSAQMSYVSDKPPGHGLIKVGGAIVPLVNEFPKDTSLYWLMTTKPGEG